MQVIIVVVYWSVLHNGVVRDIAPLGDDILYFTVVHIHWIPFAAVAINVTLSRTVLIPSHYMYIIYFGSIYLVVNYIGTLIRGKPLYPFL